MPAKLKNSKGKNPGLDDKKKKVEKVLTKIDGISLPDYSYSYNHFEVSSFSSWVDAAKQINNPDEMRTMLYMIFQPLFDALISPHSLEGSNRKLALDLYNSIKEMNAKHLGNYYTGLPDIDNFKRDISLIQGGFDKISSVEYHKKERNIDSFLKPKHVSLFIKNFLTEIIDEKITFPDYFIGCACGSSEIVFPLSYMLNMPFDFIRKSKRRYDAEAIIIPEQEIDIAEKSKGKKVVCFEDAVCSGGSLEGIMKKVNNNGASNILGVSMFTNGSYSRDTIKTIQEKCDTYGALNKYSL